MSTEVLLAFVAACVLLALTPGPNMALLVAIAAAGMTSVMVFMSNWFDAVRWAGACYLVYLGARQLWRLRERNERADMHPAPGSRRSWYLQGLIVSLSNPKVILFLGAFLPQFVDMQADPVGQLGVLAVLFVAVIVAVDIATTFAAARARSAFGAARLRLLDGAAGVFLVLGGVALAVMRRP